MKKIALILFFIALVFLVIILVSARLMGEDVGIPADENSLDQDGVSQCVTAGCSGELCVEASVADDIFTTCEFRPEYECYQQATCARLEDGECGFVEDQELLDCLSRVSQEPSFPL